MREGAWIEASTGSWHWIDEHADWIRRPDNARRAGLSAETVERLSGMTRHEFNGEERKAILLVAMEAGLIRFRGQGSSITFESTLPLEQAIIATKPFMKYICGPLTSLQFNRLPDGPSIGFHYCDMGKTLQNITH